MGLASSHVKLLLSLRAGLLKPPAFARFWKLFCFVTLLMSWVHCTFFRFLLLAFGLGGGLVLKAGQPNQV